jgi:hypothetical protein
MQQAENVALVYSFVCGKCQQRRIKTHFTSLLMGSLLPPIWGLYTMYSQNFRSIAMLWCSTGRFRRIIWNCGGICKYKIEAYACVFHESETGVSISNRIAFYKTIQLWVTSTNFMHTKKSTSVSRAHFWLTQWQSYTEHHQCVLHLDTQITRVDMRRHSQESNSWSWHVVTREKEKTQQYKFNPFY